MRPPIDFYVKMEEISQGPNPEYMTFGEDWDICKWVPSYVIQSQKLRPKYIYI